MAGTPFITPVMTLPEYLKGTEVSEEARPLIETFANSSDVMQVFPFEGLSAPVYIGYRQSGLATSMGFRGINEGSTSGAGTITPFQEATYIIDHDIPVDAAIVRRGGTRRRAWEETMGMARLGELWITNFLKGDNTLQPRVFSGLQKRSAKWGRTIPNSVASGGGPLSLLNLDKAIQNTRNPNYIIAPFDSKSLFIQAARNTALSGFVIQSWDDVGKVKMSYGGLPILWGYPKDLHLPILPFTEVGAGGGTAQTSSLYVVSFGEGSLRGIQLMPMEVRDMGLLQDGITWNTHISWDVGMVDEHPFCFTRLSSFTNAAIVA